MKRFFKLIIIFTLLLSVKKIFSQSNVLFNIETSAATNIKATSATLGGGYVIIGDDLGEGDIMTYFVQIVTEDQWKNNGNNFFPFDYTKSGIENGLLLIAYRASVEIPKIATFYSEIQDMQPGTKYYIRGGVYSGKTASYKEFYAPNILTFETGYPDGSQKIGDNTILSSASVICAENSADITIEASLPKGGLNNQFQYQWQTSMDGKTWTNDVNNQQQNYTGTVNKSQKIWYRRIVTSGQIQKSTSNAVGMTYIIGQVNKIVEHVNIKQTMVTPQNQILLEATPYENRGDHQTQWQINMNWPGGTFANIGDPFTNNIVVSNSSPTVAYKAIVTYYHHDTQTCPLVESPAVSFSEPDGDGNVYPYVMIQSQSWMINNLRTTKYNDNSEIVETTNGSSWASPNGNDYYCWYNNDKNNYFISNGALYNYYAVSNTKNACPVGWRPANNSDWGTLMTEVGGQNIAAQKLKTTGEWTATPTTSLKQGTNAYNFNALPVGFRNTLGTFEKLSEVAQWWAVKGNSDVWFMLMRAENDNVTPYGQNNWGAAGASIRCIKD